MKGEYEEQQQQQQDHNHNHHSSTSAAITISTPQNANDTNMFSKFQNHPKFLSPPPHFHHYQQYQQHSEDSEITPLKQLQTPPPSKKPRNTPTSIVTPTTTSSDDGGGTIEVSRRPRGRPPGSKNRAKPPIIITRETEPAMSPYILEVPSGSDLVESLTRFTRRRGVGICVLTATGAVSNVVLKQPPNVTPGGTVTFHGRFDILSLSATLMITNAAPFNVSNGVFNISLAGPQGQICGGKVVGPLSCAGTVYVVAASFNSPSFCRLPLEIDDVNNNQHQHNYQEEAVTQSCDRITGGDGGGQSSSPVSDGGDGNGNGGGGTHMSMYSVHHANMEGPTSSSDVLWAPTPVAANRPQQQQPPPY